MQGIERDRRADAPMEGRVGLTQIVFRYSDGREMTFVPDAGRETFSEDDILELKSVLDRTSSHAEWANINTRLGF
jgi:hypothetical protein